MADALTSTTGAVAANVLTQNLRNIDPESGVVMYVKYTKGAESKLQLQVSFADEVIGSSVFYNDVYFDSSLNVLPKVLNFTATGNFRVPISVAGNEGIIKVTPTFVTSGGNGAVVVDIRLTD